MKLDNLTGTPGWVLLLWLAWAIGLGVLALAFRGNVQIG
jgi:hypothetical protein